MYACSPADYYSCDLPNDFSTWKYKLPTLFISFENNTLQNTDRIDSKTSSSGNCLIGLQHQFLWTSILLSHSQPEAALLNDREMANLDHFPGTLCE